MSRTVWISGMLLCLASHAANLTPPPRAVSPADHGGLYYALGGGQIAPLPDVWDKHTIHLGVHGEVGLGYHCGTFDPKLSLTHSLNSTAGSLQQVVDQVLDNAQGALVELPMYVISLAFPELATLLQSAVLKWAI